MVVLQITSRVLECLNNSDYSSPLATFVSIAASGFSVRALLAKLGAFFNAKSHCLCLISKYKIAG